MDLKRAIREQDRTHRPEYHWYAVRWNLADGEETVRVSCEYKDETQCRIAGTKWLGREVDDWLMFLVKAVADLILEVVQFETGADTSVTAYETSGTAPGLKAASAALDKIIARSLTGINKIADGEELVDLGGDPVADSQVTEYAKAALRARAFGYDPKAPTGPKSKPLAFTLDKWRGGAMPLVADTNQVSLRHLELMQMLDDAGYSNGANITVAVLDTGYNAAKSVHFDTRIDAYDCTGTRQDGGDGNGHGTFCLSEIGGNGKMQGPFGGAAGAKLISIKVLTDAGWGTDDMIAAGVKLAVRLGADVVSMSLGGGSEMPLTAVEFIEARAAGVEICAASGNDGGHTESVSYPARYPEATAVGAVDEQLRIADFSNWGSEVDFCALGVGVLGVNGIGGVELWGGTSMATPFVAAMCARVLGESASGRSAQRLKESQADGRAGARDLGMNGRDTTFGAGLIQSHPAQKLAQEWLPTVPTPVPNPDPAPPADPLPPAIVEVVLAVWTQGENDFELRMRAAPRR